MLKYSFQIISFDICNKDENVLFIYIFFYKFIYFLKIYILYFCRDVSSYIVIQEEISECFKFMKTFINNEDFVKHVRKDSPDMEDIEDKLDQHLLDLERTDCSIVFAGKFFIYFD